MKRFVILFNVLFIAFICPLVTLRANAESTLPPLPSAYPEMKFTVDIESQKSNIWGYILAYRQSDNSYRLFCMTNTFEYMSEDSIYLEYDENLFCFYVKWRQPHISSDQGFDVFTYTVSTNSDGSLVLDFSESKYNFAHSASQNSSIFQYTLANDLGLDQMAGYYQIICSTLNLIYIDGDGVKQTLLAGNEDYFYSFFDGTSKPYIAQSHESCSGIEPTEPTTKDNSSEQLEVSNSILENVKNVITSIFNLPSRIANAISGFFTDLGDKIGGFLTDVKDGILEGLKFLFVPSENLFLDLIDLIKSKFGFVFQLVEITDFILHENFDDVAPDSNVTFKGNKWFGSFTVQIMDWSVIEPYRDLIKNLSLAVSWYFFIRKLQKRLPDIINGTSDGGGKKE